MRSLLRTPATAVWLVLVLATGFSWALGTDHGFGSDGQTAASVVILVVAFVKVRFIGLFFMELRGAPLVLRMLFEGYCLAACAVVTGMFLVA